MTTDHDQYRDEAQRLERALLIEKDLSARARDLFHLAQCYRVIGDRKRALETFLRRAALDVDAEERYASLLYAGLIQEALGQPVEAVVATYERASALLPDRAEALHAASRLCRMKDRFAEGYAYARRGLAVAPPAEGRFVERWVYDFGLLDEFAVNAYWIGRHQDCLDACRRLLDEGKMPEDMRARVIGNAGHAADRLRERAATAARTPPESSWIPDRPLGGTEIMVEGLMTRLGDALNEIDLRINHFDPGGLTGKPLVVWFHHDIDQGPVQWCRDAAAAARVAVFVFVSYWQMERYVRTFGLPPGRCVVLRNATDVDPVTRPWAPGRIRQIAYTSTPFRGLAILLDAWERSSPADAELHIWSSWKLYKVGDDPASEGLFERARALPGVFYRGLLPNEALRRELRTMDYLAYPSIFAETSCLSVIEAMAAGCRVICSGLGALPETTAGFARIHPWQPDAVSLAAAFSAVLADELRHPWQGRDEMCAVQQGYCRLVYDWAVRVDEWRRLLSRVASINAKSR